MFQEFFEQLRNMNEDYLIEMANVRGKDCKVEDIDFSFYFSGAQGKHSIRAKIEWNYDHIKNPDGTMELFGTYKYIPSKKSKNKATEEDINNARRFFKKYKVLFAAVWSNCLDAVDLRNYFEGRLTFDELLKGFYSIKNYNELQEIKSVDKLYEFVKKNNLFNLYEGN